MNTKIKYDKKFNKACRIILIVTACLMLISLIMILFFDDPASSWIDYIIVFVVVTSYVSVPLFLLSLVLFTDSTVYLKRLEKNHFEVPVNKKDYDNNLEAVPRSAEAENIYSKDSIYASVLALVVYVIVLVFDILYFAKWIGPEPSSAKAMIVLLLLFHLIFPLMAFIIFRQKNTEKYIDEVDVKRNGDKRKKRISLTSGIGIMVILGLIAAFSISTAHSMTKYVYKSRHGSYDKTIDDFKGGATMTVSSENLKNGVWDKVITNTTDGKNLSPQLKFDKVEGADHYVIYMIDESAHNWVHWIATDVRENELPTGANTGAYADNDTFRYVGPYPPPYSGDHIYTIYVYALKDNPEADMDFDFDKSYLGADDLYYNHLDISGKKDDINLYGNVLAYGYLSGTYGR